MNCPRYLQTLPRRGYRFLVQVEPDPPSPPKPSGLEVKRQMRSHGNLDFIVLDAQRG